MATFRVSPTRTKRGRPRKNEVITRWSISIPQKIAAPWDLIFMNPQTGAPKLGARQFILSELLRLTLNAWQAGEKSIDISNVISRISQELRDSPPEKED